ncbi:MAG TPA: hypothetical protein VLA00_06975 [Xanthobacteraceae bacterium]|nr:hypothetical protein [Xanthobacteraceae bacterium]
MPFHRIAFEARRIRGWQIALLLVAATAIGVALAVLAAGVFLVIFPIAALAGLAYRFFGSAPKPAAQRQGGVTIIDAEYRVLPDERPRDRRPGPF